MTLRKDFQFSDLVHPRNWQSIQDSLAEALGLSIRTVSSACEQLSKPSRPNSLCEGLLHKKSKGRAACNFCKDPSAVQGIQKTTNFKGPFGIDIYVIPIRAIGDQIMAYIILGPVVLKSRRDASEYAKEAAEFGIDPVALQDAMIDLNVFSYSRMDVIIKLVTEVFSNIAQTGYHKRRLGEIAPEIEELDPLFSVHYEERILTNLLNCCSLALNADSGSVMIVDRNTNKLRIKVSERIAQDIVDNTSVTMGEGIAGLAAAKSETFILPHDQNKNHLADKMNRRYIKSSMIVPFNKGNENDVYGVININVTRRSADFSEKDVAIVKELVNLASVALIPVHA